jgi:hypothetical protein
MFSVIQHIDDVLPYIADKPEFGVFEKEHYTVINYHFQDSETFNHEDLHTIYPARMPRVDF